MDRRRFLKILLISILFPLRILLKKKPNLWGGGKLAG